MHHLARLLRLLPGEGSCVSLLALQYFFIVAVTIAGKTTRDTYFLSRFDRSYLPLMFVACTVVVALLSTFYARAAAKLERQVLTSVTYALFVAVMLALNIQITGSAVPILYVWVEVVISLATLQFWTQDADSFDPRQAKRLFGLICGGGSLAAIITGPAL